MLSAVLALLLTVLSLPLFVSSPHTTADELPSAVDLRESIHLPPIGNQGAIGCCASMAITYTQFTNAYSRYIHAIDPDSTFDPSSGKAQYLFSPRFTYNLAGAGTAWVYEILKEQGAVTQAYSNFTYDQYGGAQNNVMASDWATVDGYWRLAQNYRIKNYEQIWLNQAPYHFEITTQEAGIALLEKIKSALDGGNVVVTGGYPSRWQYTTISGTGTFGKKGESAICYSKELSSGGHQVSIVGYDDEITCTVNGVTLKGAFLVANSWGESWQDQGYTWLMYDALNLTSAYDALNFSDRTWTMDQMCFLDWRTDLDISTPVYLAEIKLTTANRDGFTVTLTASDLSGNTVEYTPYMFSQEWARPYSDVNFYGKSTSETGTLAFKYHELLEKLPENSLLEDCILGVRITADSGESVTVNKLSLYNADGTLLYSQDCTDALSDGASTSYSLSAIKRVSFELPEGVSINTIEGLPYSDGDALYRFSLDIQNGYQATKLAVTCNGQRLDAVNGVYTLVIDQDLPVKVSGVTPENENISMSTYCYEYWAAEDACLYVLSIPKDPVDPALYNAQLLSSGEYPYTYRITVNGTTYEFLPSSFYEFSSSVLVRLPVANQGWLPTAGSYTMKIEICLDGVPVYTDTQVTGSNSVDFYATNGTMTEHTHLYTGSYITIFSGNCSSAGSGYQYCSVDGCHAVSKTTLPIDPTLHEYSRSSIILKPATATSFGERSELCLYCDHTCTVYFNAEQENPTPDGVTIESMDQSNVMAEDIIEVQVLLSGNPGISFLSLTPSYDKSVLTLLGATNGDVFTDIDKGVNLIFSGNEDSYADGVLVTLTFLVAKDAPAGSYELLLLFRECYNNNAEDVACTIKNAKITVIDFLYGDANDDRTVNGQDLVLLRKYLAGYDYDTGASTITVGKGTDANGDGTINGKDLVMLRKYLANYDYDSGSSDVVLGPSM